MGDKGLLIDASVTWLASIGAASLLGHLLLTRQPSVTERRIRFLLVCLTAVLAAKGFLWLYPGRWMESVRFLPASLLPLAFHLFVEGLLRRHLPLFFKIFTSGGSVVFGVGALAGLFHDGRGWGIAFIAYSSVTVFVLGLFLLLRDRKSLTPSENRLIRCLSGVAFVAAVLLLTDLGAIVPSVDVRMGGLGALLFLFVFLRVTTGRDRNESLFPDLSKLFFQAVIIASLLLLLFGQTPGDWIPFVALGGALATLVSLWHRIWIVREQSENDSFLQWLGRANLCDFRGYLESLKTCPLTEEHLVVGSEHLEGYDTEAIVERLKAAGGVLQRGVLQRSVKSKDPDPQPGSDQLLALLDTYRMSHVLLVREEGPVLVLVQYPEIADGSLARVEFSIIQKLSQVGNGRTS